MMTKEISRRPDPDNRKLLMTPLMRKYYNKWLNTPTLLENPRDADKFYQFVKACMRRARFRRSGRWLRPFLKKDLGDRFHREHTERLISEAVSTFDHIADYELVVFPEPMVEMRNPTTVKSVMRAVKKPDGTRFYTEEDVRTLISAHFNMQ